MMTGKKTASGETLAEQAVRILQREILVGRLAPGARCTIMDLSQRLGIGVTPMREALSRLSSQNLITAEGRRGFSVRDLSAEDLRDITSTRLLIEQEALRMSIKNGDDAWEASLVAALHRLRIYVERVGESFGSGGVEFDSLHHNFHTTLIAACGSPRLLDLAQSLYQQAYRYRHIFMAGHVMPINFIENHRRLADAVLSRDDTRACDLLAVHLSSTLISIYPDR